MGTTDTKGLRDAARWLRDDDADLDFGQLHAWSRDVDAAAHEIEALRSTVEERLTRYRCAYIVLVARCFEYCDEHRKG